MPLSRYKIARPLLAVSRHSPVRLTSASVAPHESHGEVGVVHRGGERCRLTQNKRAHSGPLCFFRRIPLLLCRSVCRLRRILRGRAFGLSGFFLVALILVSAGQASAALGFAMRKRVLGVCWRGRGAGAGRLFFLRSFSRRRGGR